MKIKILGFLVMISGVTFGQNAKVLKGKVVAPTKELYGINIRNLSSQKETSTIANGEFSITAKSGDTLLFTAVQLQPRKIVLEKEDFDYLPFFVKMNVKVTQLKEVVVEKSNITAESLGLVPKGMKTPSQEERAVRRYYTSQTGPFESLIYAIDGTAKRRKKEIIAALGRQRLQHKLELMFDQSFFIDELKIPSDYLYGFYVFASENQGLAKVIEQKNKWLIKFELMKLAHEYSKQLSSEN